VILKFDGKPIEKSTDLPRLVGATKPGTRSSITVFRRGNTLDLMVTVAEIEPEKVAAKKAPEEKPKVTSAGQAFGLSVSEVSDADKKELRLKGGVRVDAATEAAARAGLRAGDIILAIANQEISQLKDFEAIVSKADKSKSLQVLFRRGDWAQYTVIRPLK
jgi:serine protease Do